MAREQGGSLGIEWAKYKSRDRAVVCEGPLPPTLHMYDLRMNRHPDRWKELVCMYIVMYLLLLLLYIHKKGYNSKSVRSGTKAGDSSILF